MTRSFGSRALPPPTSAELALQDKCRKAGCEACHQLGLPLDEHCGAREYNHILVAGEAIGERFGYSLGRWHHQGFVKRGSGLDFNGMVEKYGPNLRDQKRAFHAMFGSDQTLLNGQRDRIGEPREEIPSKRELRERNPGVQLKRKASPTARPIKGVAEWLRR
jgi:hypothetical protein